jgi:hypothetical protein
MRQLSAQQPWPLSNGHTPFQPQGANLIDDAGALTNQSLEHAMQCPQVELFDSLRRHKIHSRALDRLCDRLCIAEVVLLPVLVQPYILRWHQPGVVTQCLQLPTEVIRTNTGFHADRARRQIA